MGIRSMLKSVAKKVFTKDNAMSIASIVIKGIVIGRVNSNQRDRIRRRR